MKVGTPTHSVEEIFYEIFNQIWSSWHSAFQKKKNIFMADPKPRGMNEICSFKEVPVYTRKGVVVFKYNFQLDTPKDLLFICWTIASTLFYAPEI